MAISYPDRDSINQRARQHRSRKGLHEAQLKEWRELVREAALGALGSRKAE
jgi:hypothetical protein